jgi:hypothetical protein
MIKINGITSLQLDDLLSIAFCNLGNGEIFKNFPVKKSKDMEYIKTVF